MNDTLIRRLRQADDLLEKLLFQTSAWLVLIISVLVCYAVFARYVLGSPPLWAEDAPRVFFLWSVYLGIAVATKRGQNIRVTFFIEKIAPRPRLVLETIMHLLVIIMIVVIFWNSFPILQLQARGSMLSTGWSYAWTYAALPVGCALMTFYQIRIMLRGFVEYGERSAGNR